MNLSHAATLEPSGQAGFLLAWARTVPSLLGWAWFTPVLQFVVYVGVTCSRVWYLPYAVRRQAVSTPTWVNWQARTTECWTMP